MNKQNKIHLLLLLAAALLFNAANSQQTYLGYYRWDSSGLELQVKQFNPATGVDPEIVYLAIPADSTATAGWRGNWNIGLKVFYKKAYAQYRLAAMAACFADNLKADGTSKSKAEMKRCLDLYNELKAISESIFLD